MSFVSARLGALRRLAPSRPSPNGGCGGGGGGKASNSPARRVGEDDDGRKQRRRRRFHAVAKAGFVAAPLVAVCRPARAGFGVLKASASPSDGGLEK